VPTLQAVVLMGEYEVYREKIVVTRYVGDAVFETRTLEIGWFDEDVIAANNVHETDVMYVAASDEFAKTHMTIRKKRKAT
jgi:hypothetical protein